MHALGFRLRRQATVAPGCWLVFERQTPPFIERLMGWTGGGDTLPQIELTFPTLDAAVAYAERQGLDYLVQAAADTDARRNRTDGEPADRQAFLDMLTARLALAWLHTRYGIGGPTPSLDREKGLSTRPQSSAPGRRRRRSRVLGPGQGGNSAELGAAQVFGRCGDR